jgi:hypothetical protein
MKNLIPTIHIQFDSDKEIRYSLPKECQMLINELHLEINCGFNMYNKRIKITLIGEDREFELPVVTLSQMYRLHVPVIPGEDENNKWTIKGFRILPCQKNNYSVFLELSSS